jgi:hypothetical protein
MAFWHHLQPSPFHLKGSTQLCPFAKALFQAFNNVNPAAKRQQAITPKLLRGMFRLAGVAVDLTHDSPAAIIAELSIVAFFFAMGSHGFLRVCHHADTRQNKDHQSCRRHVQEPQQADRVTRLPRPS